MVRICPDFSHSSITQYGRPSLISQIKVNTTAERLNRSLRTHPNMNSNPQDLDIIIITRWATSSAAASALAVSAP
jgi:hypothetical protein